MFTGSIVALVTPFRDGLLDEEALRELVGWHLRTGTHGIVVAGTTGEGSALSCGELERLVGVAVDAAGGRLPVIAGTGTSSTRETIEKTRLARAAGAAGALVVVPYYVVPDQEGLYEHFRAVHEAVELPLVVYNIPFRTGADLAPQTLLRLLELPRVVGVKDCSFDLARVARLRRQAGARLAQLAGDDRTVAAALVQGCVGCVSVVANALPELCAELHEAWRRRDVERVIELDDRLQPFVEVLGVGPNPAPIKYLLSRFGLSSAEVRPPIAPLGEAARAALDELAARVRREANLLAGGARGERRGTPALAQGSASVRGA